MGDVAVTPNPAQTNTKSIIYFRYVRIANRYLIVCVDNVITIDVFIFNITRTNVSKVLFGAIGYIFF